jgi:PD-(D/E)XK nuclease superfamily
VKLLTNSRMKTFRSCQRKHFYSYTKRYRPLKVAEALYFGTMLHKIWAQYWELRRCGWDEEYRLLKAVEALPVDMDPYLRAKAIAMVAAYTSLWDRIAVKVLAVEIEFQMPLINPETGAASRTWRLGGKLDVIVEWLDENVFPHRRGQMAILEHKSTSEDLSPGSVYHQKLTMDGQVSQYFAGSRVLGPQFGFEQADFLVYDVSAKPAIRPYEATPIDKRKYKKDTGELYANQRDRDETPDEFAARCAEVIKNNLDKYFAKSEIVRLERDAEEFRFDVWTMASNIRESERTGVAPRNPDACFQYHGRCPYFSVCASGASLDDKTQFRIADQENEELSPAVKPIIIPDGPVSEMEMPF